MQKPNLLLEALLERSVFVKTASFLSAAAGLFVRIAPDAQTLATISELVEPVKRRWRHQDSSDQIDAMHRSRTGAL